MCLCVFYILNFIEILFIFIKGCLLSLGRFTKYSISDQSLWLSSFSERQFFYIRFEIIYWGTRIWF